MSKFVSTHRWNTTQATFTNRSGVCFRWKPRGWERALDLQILDPKWYLFPETNSKCSWKSIVGSDGRWKSFSKGFDLFCRWLLTVCFREGTVTSRMKCLHPGRLTWNLKMMVWKMIFLFNWVIFRFYVKFRGCMFIQKTNHWKSRGVSSALLRAQLAAIELFTSEPSATALGTGAPEIWRKRSKWALGKTRNIRDVFIVVT